MSSDLRALACVPAEPIRLTAAIRAALDGSGAAVLPYPPQDDIPSAPDRVPPDVALVIRTSGTSGRPKSVAISADALRASAAATERVLGGPGEWVLALPGHYIAAVQVIVRALAAGGEPHPVAPGPFTAAAFATAVAGLPPGRPRYSALVPTQLHRLVDAVEVGDDEVGRAVRTLDAILIGGARLDDDLAARADRAGIRVVRTYGSSETSGGCVYDGVPLPGVDVRTVDGEIQLSGPTLAHGYLDDATRTAETFVQDAGRRWYRTGDAGRWDAGTLTVDGRLDDVIVTGGEKVSLGLVERVVRAVPGLAEAHVVSAPDDEWGDVPVVITTVAADLEVVRAAVTDQLGRVAAPRAVLVVAELPMLSSGKPDRRQLTDWAAAR